MRYIYDFDDTMDSMDGYEKIGERLVSSGVSADIVFIVKDESVFYIAYKYIKKALERSSSVRAILVGDIENKYRQLCLLMMSHKNYNVYNVEDVSEIDSEYLDVIFERECTAEEIETFFGSEMAVYPEMRDMLIKITDSVKAGDVDSLISFLSVNADKISSMAGLVDFMQVVIDDLSLSGLMSRVDDSELKKQVDKLRGELSRAKSDYDLANRQLFEKNNSLEAMSGELEKLKSRLSDLSSGDKGSAAFSSYTTLSLDRFVSTSMANARTPKIKEVIYFKEINPCRFINTFIVTLNNVMSYIKEISTKLIIYDNKSYNNIKYIPLPVVELKDYMAEKDTTLSKCDKLVIVEPSRVILEDALMVKDCLLIYDRLGREEDIVAGKHVHKYYIVNSVKDIHALESVMAVDKSKIITNLGVSKQCISIKDIKDFKTLTPNGKISTYLNMFNMGEDTRTVFDIILSGTGADKLARR